MRPEAPRPPRWLPEAWQRSASHPSPLRHVCVRRARVHTCTCVTMDLAAPEAHRKPTDCPTRPGTPSIRVEKQGEQDGKRRCWHLVSPHWARPAGPGGCWCCSGQQRGQLQARALAEQGAGTWLFWNTRPVTVACTCRSCAPRPSHTGPEGSGVACHRAGSSAKLWSRFPPVGRGLLEEDILRPSNSRGV